MAGIAAVTAAATNADNRSASASAGWEGGTSGIIIEGRGHQPPALVFFLANVRRALASALRLRNGRLLKASLTVVPLHGARKQGDPGECSNGIPGPNPHVGLRLLS